MVKLRWETFLKNVLIGTAVLTTVAISPSFQYDPINLPKMLVIVTGASILLIPLILELREIKEVKKSFPSLVLLFLLLLTASMFSNPVNVWQQLWGTWGRSTGLLSYWAFFILLMTAYLLAIKSNVESIRITFERLSYFISAYTLAQAADLDPINWSQKLMVATLGNINFMSSFLGLASCSMFVRIICEKISVTSKVHFAIFITLNSFLIWISGSIQGIGVVAAGISLTVAFKIRSEFGFRKSIYWLITVVPAGLTVLLGTAGVGPLSKLEQETVVFRLDYWRAGIRMTIENWVNGVGLDSYGDYYEQYRDMDAVFRTGPQRVTNTAHNIFLDVASGSGMVIGLLFLMIFAVTLIKIYRMLKQGQNSSTDIAFASIFAGFIVFCFVSINQIGVGVWGFIVMGCLNGVNLRKEKHTKTETKSKARNASGRYLDLHSDFRESWKVGNFAGTVLIGLFGATLAFIPNVIDARMLQAVQQLDFDEMRTIASSDFSTSFHRNKYQTLAMERSRAAEALNFALKEVERNPRNGISLRIIAYSNTAPREMRLEAIEKLRDMDPFNADFLKELQDLQTSIS